MILLELALYFALLSCIAFGGLPAVVPEMQRIVVDVKAWASADEFIHLFAIAQAAPGPNILFASLVGWKVAGLAGALVALVSICGPAAVISWWVSDLWERYKEAAWRVALQRAIAPLVVSLIFCGGFIIATPDATPDWRLWLLAAASATAMLATKLNPLWILSAGAVAGAALLSGCAAMQAPTISSERIAAIIASPERSAADRTNDLRRKPAEMLVFIGVREGMVALDVSAGGGYTTELLARAVGPTGQVYGQTPRPDPRERLAARAKTVANIVPVVRPFESPAPPGVAFDLVTLMFNYHDLANVDRAQMNRSVFAALKPGGFYVIADHSGRAGTGISEWNTLHRIEEAFLRREVEAAGFQLVAEGQFLRNPGDRRDRETPDPPQPKDEFILKFRKP